MNRRKPKGKGRKLSELEVSSGDDSSDRGGDSDSDVEEGKSGEEEEEEEDESLSDSSQCSSDTQSSSDLKLKKARRGKSACVLLSDSSDSGDENSEKCAICLRSITSQEVGNPEVCDHLFCSVCIIEWSKNSNVCPLDRQQFSIILVRENKDGDVAKKVPVEEPQADRVENIELEELDETVCEICGSGDREDILLLCDICDRGFHTVCLTPPLENIPDENEWFCPNCDCATTNPGGSLAEFFDVPSTSRSLRPRIQMVRTRLLERIRVTVNRIVENYVLQHPDELESSEEESALESFGSGLSSESDGEDGDVQPGTSTPGDGKKTTGQGRKRKATKRRTRSRKSTKKTTRKRKTTSTKRKSSSGRKRKGKTKKTRVKTTTRTKRVKVENADGTITEKIIRTRTYKKRRQKKKKYKVKTLGAVRRGLRVKSVTTPKTVKGRLALTLGMVPPRKPGQLLPDVKIRVPNSHVSAIDLNRARAGIPKLHIFGPRDELQYYSSESEHEEFIGGGSGGVATVVPQRSNVQRLRDRKKAALALRSTPGGPKPKPVIEAPSSESVDILGSILQSQTLWHSKNTKVKINEDGSAEAVKDKESGGGRVAEGGEGRKGSEKPEGTTTQAPMYPGTGSRAGGFRPHSRNSYGETRSRGSGQDSGVTPRGSQSSGGLNFNRFGAPARNDREGYTNYLNNMPQGPTPFCRGGPPLRFRMPPRQQLRRITIPVRNRQRGEEGEEGDGEGEEEGENSKEKGEEGKGGKTEEKGSGEQKAGEKEEEEDLDLYSDIETNAEKTDNSGAEDGGGANYPALGPPPEPPAFLLSLEENGGGENKDKSQVYDPAEPCDSEEEMVIDENKESPGSEKAESEGKEKATSGAKETGKQTGRKTSSSEEEEEEEEEEDNDDDCPIFSIYSSVTREFSQKEEEERQKEIAEDRRKMEEMKLQEAQEKGRPSPAPARGRSRSRSKSVSGEKVVEARRSSSRSPGGRRKEGRSSPEGKKQRKGERKSKNYKTESEEEEEGGGGKGGRGGGTEDEEKSERGGESGSETVSQKIATGLEGLEVEEVSSENEEEGAESSGKSRRSLSSLSLSELSNVSRRSRSPVQGKKRKKNKKRRGGKSKSGKNYEEGEIDDSEKDNRGEGGFGGGTKGVGGKASNENASKGGEKKRRRSSSTGSGRQVLGSKENKKAGKEKSKERDLSWKKPSKKEKNYREGKKRSKERGRSRSRSRDGRRSKSPTPKKEKKKSKDRKKKTEKKKELERYDVRKIVKNKEVRKTDAFGRDIVSKSSRSVSRSRSRSPIRGRSRNMLRRDSRSFSRSRSRSFRRGRSPARRRYARSRSRSRSNSVRRSYSRSRSRSRSRKSKRKPRSKERVKGRSRSRGRKSRSVSRGGVRRRSGTRSRSRSPVGRGRNKKAVGRPRRSWSHQASRSASFSPRRSRSVSRSPVRVRRSYSRSPSSRSWSRGRSPLPRTSSLEKLTVVLTTKDKKKKKKEGKKSRKEEKKRRKAGNSKEVFASGDNVLVSVNFRNSANSSGSNVISSENRSTRMKSSSPVVGEAAEGSRKKKKGSEYEGERAVKKAKKSNPISKKVVDVALSNACPKRAKKLTRLSEKDAEVILNRKPVAVIDLDMSPYREQTPSPVNVVVVSDSGSGDEGKEHTPQRANARGTPAAEVEIIQENVVSSQSANVSVPSSPLENGHLPPSSGPKTPPEPQIKFSINKPQQLRQIANPLGDDDDDDDEEGEDEVEHRVESLDRRIEKELSARTEAPHKGPNTPPAPRGPSTPKTPPSPQTSPDAYDPFEPTKSRSPSPSQADKENRPSPKVDGKDEQTAGPSGDSVTASVPKSANENPDKANDVISENHEDKAETTDKSEPAPVVDSSVIPTQAASAPPPDVPANESPERKIAVIMAASQGKAQPQPPQKPFLPTLKPLPSVSTPASSASTTTTTSDSFSTPSPTKTTRSGAPVAAPATITATQTLQMTGIQRLQHRLGSPVNRTPNSVKSTPEKRSTPRTEANEVASSGNYLPRNAGKRNGEQQKQPRPLQDATNETIDMTMDLDDSPYSPASSEGDDLFDPPVDPPKPSNSKSAKPPPKPTHKSPVKQLSKFDLLFGPTLSPVKTAAKKPNAKLPAKTPAAPKPLPQKPQKKPPAKKNAFHKMDEDQLRILDDLPSSAVELQVKDKFLKKLNRQERVVDEVKTVLKPHYARKHITKEEYKDILRRSVPKICHSRSGEINPSKIQSLIEAYVRKFRHAKKKGINAVSKPKAKKTMFS